MDDKTTVYVVDDDPSIQRTLPRFLRAAHLHVESYGSAEEFLEDYNPAQPGCLVLDLRMPGMSGLELQSRLRSEGAAMPIIFFSAYGAVATATQAMKNGAVYFLEKPIDPDELVDRIQEALVLDAQKRKRQALKAKLNALSSREYQILKLIVEGCTSDEMAEHLCISKKTVDIHRAHIMDKLQARNVADVVRITLFAEQPID